MADTYRFGSGMGRGRGSRGGPEGEAQGAGNGNGNGNGNGHGVEGKAHGRPREVGEQSHQQAAIVSRDAARYPKPTLASRPDKGGTLGSQRKAKVNFFPVQPTQTDVYVYGLTIEQTPWKEFEPGFDKAGWPAPRPLQPLERHEILYQLRSRADKGEQGMLDFGQPGNCIVYDGNAILVTRQPIPAIKAMMEAWNPDTGRSLPAFHFGTVPEGGQELDEDARGRELTLRRFAVQLADAQRPSRYRTSLQPVCDPDRLKDGVASNKFDLKSFGQAWGTYEVTTVKIFEAILSQWCLNQESEQREAWFGRRPSVALANPYAPGRDPAFKIPLPNGIEVWYGIYFNVRLGCVNDIPTPFVNLDTATGVMYTEQTVMEYFAQLLGGLPPNVAYPPSFTASQAVTINRNCTGLKVMSTHIKRTYTVKAFRNDQTPANTRFACEEYGGEVSVAEYFLQKYKYKLNFPEMGMVEVKTPRGRGNQTMFLPVEVLEVLKKQEAKQLPDNAASIMIKKLCTPAPERESRIMKLAEMARFGADAWTQSFGLQITPGMHSLPSRVLPAPPIVLGQRTPPPRVKDGVWDIKGPLLEPKGTEDQAVIILSFARIHNAIGKIAQDAWEALRRQAKNLGMNLFPNIYLFNQNLSADYDTMVKQICGAVAEAREQEKKIQLIIVLMKERNPTLYGGVKYVGDHFLGIPSQCLLLKTVSPLKTMTATNVLIKINAKLGGANFGVKWEAAPGGQLSLLTEPCLVMGVESSEPRPGSQLPSIAAVVANTDRDLSKWNATIAVSKTDLEPEIPYFRYAFEKRMFEFVKKTKRVPRHIFVFRDGISESQYEQIMARELAEVKESINKMYSDAPAMPKLTFIVCIKRHHVRFFPAARGDAVGKSMNVAPGTVVDRDVASPTNFDYWLMSHFGLQGTCRPTYYQVLYDENGLSSDQVQLMSYWLCHIYARCPRSVSWPTPTYYAHLAAERARYHLTAEHTSREDSKVSSSSPSSSDHGTSAYTPTASMATDPARAGGSSSSSTSTSSSSSSSGPDEEARVRAPEDVYKGVSAALHRLQMAATVSSAYHRNDNLYFA